ncbi:MAG TPA: hypothetical protein VHW93_06890 [Acidimicrobiales bacterium]|nr:hypothetical protein [Acidimicrobiales bacterium]
MTKGKMLLRAGLVSLAMAGMTGAGLAGTSSAGASPPSIEGTYSYSFDWTGYPPVTTTITFGADHQFADGGGDAGKYMYKGHKLKYKYTDTDCKAQYKGTGTPAAGFSGTSVIKNSRSDCIPKGTKGTWSIEPESDTTAAVTRGASAAGRP